MQCGTAVLHLLGSPSPTGGITVGRYYKEGVEYWNIDVDLYENKKFRLFSAEFGLRGEAVFFRILSEIYRTGGYYKKWDFDDCLLLSAATGGTGGCSPELIAEIVQGLIRRSFFEKRVFDSFGVLTSAEIQRRFLRIVGKSRDTISMIEEYFLLDTSSRKDVSEGTLGKIALFSISSAENAETRTGNAENRAGNPQRKEQKRNTSSSQGKLATCPDVRITKGKRVACFPPDSDPYKAARYLEYRIRQRLPSKKPADEETLLRWAADIEKIHRLDGQSWDDIADVLEFSQTDPFWQNNILSGRKFREQFLQLMAKMGGDKR